MMMITAACTGNNNTTGDNTTVDNAVKEDRQVEFVADSALAMLQAQCAFGARVPGTAAHAECVGYIEKKLSSWADTVVTQKAQVTTFDGVALTAQNIMGRFNPEADTRILLLAHYDCRPWADKDENAQVQRQPVMGANDAASGVAVLMELARIMKANRPEIGIDLLFVDVEDWGDYENDGSWALGTQAWAGNFRQLLGSDYSPTFGILLDMVGARGARFAPEYFSTQNAASVVQLVWDTAREQGYGNYFVNNGGGAVTDDHVVINNVAGIPCIDIIDMRGDGFFDGWHTTHDTVDNIDAATLKAVGQTLSHIIYNY